MKYALLPTNMHKILILLLAITSTSHAQLNILGPIEYSGYIESVRTVHFSEDGTKVLGDWDHLVEWDINNQTILRKTEIPGYSVYKSAFDGATFWMNGNSNYNSEVPDISNVHNNINVLDSSGMSAHKTTRPYGFSAIIKGTKDAVILASTDKNTYQVVRLNTETLEESTIYFDETKHGAAVPTAIKISDDGKYVGVSLAGENAGLRIYDLETGTLLLNRKSDFDANDFAFSGDGHYIFVNDGASVIQINTKYWRDITIWDLSGVVTSIDVNSNASYVVMGFDKKKAILMNVRSGSVEATLSTDKVNDVTFSDDGQFIGLGLDKRVKSEKTPSIILFKLME